MRALVQRVAESLVTVNGEQVGSTAAGLVVFLGVAKGDDEADARYLVEKTVNLRIFADESNRFQLLRPGHRGGDSFGKPVHPVRRHPPRPPS